MIKRALVLFFFVLLTVSIVSAEITIEGPEFRKYNIGERLKISSNVVHSVDLVGFLSSRIQCTDEEFEYFFIPTDLKGGNVKKIDIGNLIVQEEYIGDCIIIVELLSSSRESLEKVQSGTITFTDAVELIAELDSSTVKPSESNIIALNVISV